jgi:hypothetical protein
MGMEGGGVIFSGWCAAATMVGRPVVRVMPRAKRFSIAWWCDFHWVLAMIIECL